MPKSSDAQLRAWLETLDADAEKRPGRHALRMALIVVVGYLYPALVLSGAAALVGGTLWCLPYALAKGDGIVWWLALAAFAVWVAWSVVLACAATLGEPRGHLLGSGEAPELRKLVEEVRAQVRGVRVDEIRLATDFNASVAQFPARGLLGGDRNVLTLGLPLLAVLSRDELACVLAHEFGHLARGHGLLGRWIYRVQESWQALGQKSDGSRSLSWLLLGWFLSRYPEYLGQATLAYRRRHEREADRLAAGARGASAFARTLMRVDFWSDRLDRDFWPEQLRQAATATLPPADVMDRLAGYAAQPGREDAARAWAQRQASRRTNVWASHPCLAERCAALDVAGELSQDAALAAASAPVGTPALELLGADGRRHIDRASRLWKAEIAAGWRERHDVLKHARTRLEKPDPETEKDPVERAWLLLELDLAGLTIEDAQAALGAFLAEHPEHAKARFALGRARLWLDDERGIGDLEAAMAADAELVAEGLEMMLEHHREHGDDAAADAVQERLERAQAAMPRA